MVCERCGTIFCWDRADTGTLDGSRRRFCSRRCRVGTRQSRTHHPEWSCERKVRHDSADSAAAAMAEINAVLAARDPGDRLQGWYPCPYCDGFHLTSVPVAERTAVTPGEPRAARQGDHA